MLPVEINKAPIKPADIYHLLHVNFTKRSWKANLWPHERMLLWLIHGFFPGLLGISIIKDDKQLDENE